MDYKDARQHLESCLNSYEVAKSKEVELLEFAIETFQKDINQVNEKHSTILKTLIIMAKDLTTEKLSQIKSEREKSAKVFVRICLLTLFLTGSYYSLKALVFDPINKEIHQYYNVQPKTGKNHAKPYR